MPTTIKQWFEFRDIDGISYKMAVGTNDAGRRILVLFTKGVNAREWKPCIEQDIDIEAKYADTQTGIPTPPADVPPKDEETPV